MNVPESVMASPQLEASPAVIANGPVGEPVGRRPRRRVGKLISVLSLLTIVVLAVSLARGFPDQSARLLSRVIAAPSQASPGPALAPPDPAPPPWDGRIELAEGGRRGLGLATALVEPQTRPIQI